MRHLLLSAYYMWAWIRSSRNSKKNRKRGLEVGMDNNGKETEQEWSVREEDNHASVAR